MRIARKIRKEIELAAKRVPRWMKGLGFPARRVWQASLADEVRFFDRRLKDRARFFPGFDDPNLPLQEKYVRLLESFGNEPVEILDVGSGPLTAVGRAWGAVQIRVVPTDALADAYSELLDKHGIEPPFPPVQCEGEQLEARFGAGAFDLVVANNSIDHCYDPLAVVENMVAVAKEGHSVFLRHKINEGSNRKFTGMHQWNFTEEGGDFVIRDGKVTINVSREFAGRAHTDAKRDGDFLVVTITKKPPGPPRGTQGGVTPDGCG